MIPRRQFAWFAFLAVSLTLVCRGQGQAAPPQANQKFSIKEIGIEPLNEAPGWLVRVSVDRPDRTYKAGDAVSITVRSEKAGYLYLFNLDAGGDVSLLFPSRRQPNNQIQAGQDVPVPADARAAQIIVAPPFGKELIWAIVTSQPAGEFQNLQLQDKPILVPVDRFKEMLVRLSTGQPENARNITVKAAVDRVRRDNPGKYARQCLGWAEHRLEITTVQNAPVAGEARRAALFVGISTYQDPTIRSLHCSHKDAVTMEALARGPGRFTQTAVLTNENATLSRIRAEFSRLVSSTRPGDTVLIYWSGHGGRCNNLDGTEPDGLDAYLVPHDGMLARSRETMLLDKSFARWVQELDGRKVMVIIDACHSGGNIAGMKAPQRARLNRDGSPRFARGVDSPDVRKDARWTKRHFLDTEFVRIKNIGQKDAAVLASCTFKQFAFEREEQDMGVMTYYLVEKANSQRGPLTIREVAEYVQKKVPEYVEKRFPGSPQTPIFSDQTAEPRPRLLP